MKQRTRNSMTIGLLAFGLCGMLLPWIRTLEHGSITLSAPGERTLLFYPSSKADVGFNEGFRIDYTRLGLEWMVIGVFTGLGYLVLGRPEST